jgi:FMN phosphatase YigB (HAD superfamily)
MPDAYLFDIGNVIITFDFSIAARKIASHATVSPEEVLALVSPLTIDLELGKITPAAFIEAASGRIGYSGDPDYFHASFADIFELNLPMVAFIESLKAEGQGRSICSRTPTGSTCPSSRRRIRSSASSTGASIRTRSDLMKPDPAIYEVVKSTLPLDPASAPIYIDDLPRQLRCGQRPRDFSRSPTTPSATRNSSPRSTG